MKVLTLAFLAGRDGFHCPHCGVTEGLTVQHRAVKGMGGRDSAERPSNGIVLCWRFNGDVESSAAAAELALSRGWKLLTSADPESSPVYDVTTDSWFQPTDDGLRHDVPGPSLIWGDTPGMSPLGDGLAFPPDPLLR